jgi:uracil-DNA glycosylase family 4
MIPRSSGENRGRAVCDWSRTVASTPVRETGRVALLHAFCGISPCQPSPTLSTITAVSTAVERREQLKQLYSEASQCVRCPLHHTRTKVVFGAGNADAELMFIGEAPGANEDRLGLPFVGAAGKLLDTLLSEIGMERGDVWICNLLKCRPPDNRDPHPTEIDACQEYLHRQIELVEPAMICTLGNFSTKLLRGDVTGISRLHGHEEIRVIGPRAVRLYPLYHPAAALYTGSTLEALKADFHRIPELLALGAPAQPDPIAKVPELEEPLPAPHEPAAEELEPASQLGLF